MVTGNIVFLCTENSARSQMAEGFAKKYAPEGVSIFSAGTSPTKKVHPVAVEVMKEFDIDISHQSPKSMSQLSDRFFSIAITLCRSAARECSALPGAPALLQWDILDPAEVKGSPADIKKTFRKVAEKVKDEIFNLFDLGYFNAIASQQQNFISLLNSVSNATLAHNLDRKIFYISEKAAALIGAKPIEIIGMDCHDVFKPRLCGEKCSFCNPGIEPDFDVKTYETVYHMPDGTRKELGATAIPLKNIDGSPNGVVLSLEDKTELVTMERQLSRQKSFRGIVGYDHQMMQIFQQIRDVALYDYPVHVHGETGVGKELIARAIHDESSRKTGPFVPINCGALPEGLVESELFGHVKGAFSGAIRDKKGRIEMAGGGTVFLDEIADLSKTIQVKLLRFLQEGTLEKVGSEKPTQVNVRIISATNKDLKEEVNKNTFREDLYYRLCVIPFDIPPLRKRKNDILLLCEFFLEKIHEIYTDKNFKISGEAMSMLMDYDWPGNVRELENAIRFATVKCRDGVIMPEDLPMELQAENTISPQRGPAKKLDLETARETLLQTGGNKAKAARILGVGRATLYRFLNDHPELNEI